MPDPSTLALSSLTASLVAALVWLLKHFASKTLPELEARHAAQMDRLCTLFRDDCENNRRLAYNLHSQMSEKVVRLSEAVEANQRSLLTLIERIEPNGQYPYPKLWKPPLGECSHLPRPDDRDGPEPAA
jgi:hypothetical protein